MTTKLPYASALRAIYGLNANRVLTDEKAAEALGIGELDLVGLLSQGEIKDSSDDGVRVKDIRDYLHKKLNPPVRLDPVHTKRISIIDPVTYVFGQNYTTLCEEHGEPALVPIALAGDKLLGLEPSKSFLSHPEAIEMIRRYNGSTVDHIERVAKVVDSLKKRFSDTLHPFYDLSASPQNFFPKTIEFMERQAGIA